MEKLAIKDLTFRYKKVGPDIIENMNFSLEKGSFNVIYGPSGCGKSTLMKIIAGLYPEYSGHLTSGKIFLDGQDTSEWDIQEISRHVAILFQNPNDQFAMTTVKQEFVFTLENLGIPSNQIDEIIDRSLERIGIESFLNRQINTLSGGELQKVSIAITLAMDNDFIILDEPFASVDSKSRAQLLKILKDLQVNDHKTILVADHDLNGYQHLIDELYHFNNHTVENVIDAHDVFERYQNNSIQLHFEIPEQNKNDSIMNLHELDLNNGSKSLIDSSTLALFQGKMLLLTGENGSGKSTFFAAMTRLHDFGGEIDYKQKSILKYSRRKFARQVGLVFQDAQMQYLKLTVQEEIDLSLKHSTFKQNWTHEVIDDYLLRLNLFGLKDHIVYQLSGGQKKKLQIFEMMVLGTPVLLLDEPLAGLDIDSIEVVMDIIQTISLKQNQTIIMISHQLGGLQNYFDYHLQLADKQLRYSEVVDYQSIS
jgi:energy-coupling factor transport system ATP-binding protein